MHTTNKLKIGLFTLVCFFMALAGKAEENINQAKLKDSVNHVSNPGFELNFNDSWQVRNLWDGVGKGEVVSNIKRNGKSSVKMSKTNSFGYVQLSSKKTVKVLPGQIFTFRFWFNSSNAQLTSFLIPRIVTNNATPAISNPHSGLYVDFDYDSQSLMRNSPTTNSQDWIKRVVFYENKTKETQEIYLQVMLYGNPFDVYLDDFEFIPGKVNGIKEPADPIASFSEEQVEKILSERGVETALVTSKDGKTEFFQNGKQSWPVFYRALVRKNSESDAGGFGQQGININNVVMHIMLSTYNWSNHEKVIKDILTKNPHAQLLLDLDMDPDSIWVSQHKDDTWETKTGKKLHVVSYFSGNWRAEGAKNIDRLMQDMKKHGYLKIVAGANVVGGHDWQFWTKVIGEYAADYSPVGLAAWQKYLKQQYGEINSLNQTWATNFKDFNSIPIPDPATDGESLPAIMPKGSVSEYRIFGEANAFELREHFAKAFKNAAGKDVFVSAYSMPMENQHHRFLKMAGKQGKANNMIASMSFYPYRQPGFASGYHPEQSFGFHKTGFLQELDLRYHISDKGWYDEQVLMWCSSQPDIKSWRNMHRKLVGISLAQDQGYWYYDMDKQFREDELLNEIGVVKKIADTLLTKKGVDFRPDVCLVRFDAESKYYGSSVDNAVGATVQWQYMQLETSGVPYDVHYLSDIMTEPSLKDYKIFIFHNNTHLSESDKAWINANLKKNNKTLIWMYDSGYLTDKGLSTNALSELTGMKIQTAGEGYTRSIATITGKSKMVGGEAGFTKVPAFQGMAEALCAIFTAKGPSQLMQPFVGRWGYAVAPGVSRYQKFWVTGGYDVELSKYREDGKTAMAVKYFPDWTSIYIGAPNALAGEMMNNIAKESKAYISGAPAMGEVRMNGKFVSYHALKSGNYQLNLPANATTIKDAETGKILAKDVKSWVIDGKAQNTYWYFIE